MRTRRCCLLLCSAFSVFLYGCQPQGIKFQALIQKNEFDEAARYYTANSSFFQGDTASKYSAELKQLADHLNQKQADRLDEAVRVVTAQSWPKPQEQWGDVRVAVVKSTNVLADYESSPLLAKKEYRSPVAQTLADSLAKLTDSIKGSAVQSFREFDHFGNASFFAIFPLDIDASSFVEENFSAITARLRSANSGQLQQFLKLYPRNQALGDKIFQEISDMSLAAYVREAKQSQSRLAVSLGAYLAAQKAGFQPSSFPEVTVGIIQSEQLKTCESAVKIDVDVPITAIKSASKQIAMAADSAATDYVIVLDCLPVETFHQANKSESVSSSFLSGYRTEPNPDYVTAINKVNRARANLSQMQLENTLRRDSPGYGWAGVLGAVGRASSEWGAQAELDKAIAEFKSTPPTREIPVYQDYSFRKTFLDSKKVVRINYYFLDRRKRSFVALRFEAGEAKKHVVLYQLHENDRTRDVFLGSGVLENAVADWEKAAVKVKMSEIIASYIREDAPSVVSASMTELDARIASLKKTTSAEIQRASVDRQSITDPRFEKVVVVYNRPKGALGSGFFVAPDIVLTNYHVVENATYVEMKMFAGQETFGKVLKYDARLDLALIKVQARGTPVELYSDPELKLGSTVEAIGHPEGLEFSITRGIVSALRKQSSILAPGTGDVLTIQTDATVNHGNSGGPLFLGDKAIGVVTYIYRPTKATESLNFAIHYSEVARFIKDNLPPP